MNVEIGAEAVQFPDKEYINGIAVAVRSHGISMRQRELHLPEVAVRPRGRLWGRSTDWHLLSSRYKN